MIVSLAAGLGIAAWQADKAAHERDAARRDAAREEAVRYSLTGLFRAIQQLGNGLGGAREANESLTLELEGLRDLLGVARERHEGGNQ